MRGTVHGIRGGVYRVRLDSGDEVDASLRGRLKQEVRRGSRVVIGDRVEMKEGAGASATIEGVLPRRSEIVRKGAGGRQPKVIAANVDRLVVVMAVARPQLRRFLLDRLLVVGESNHLQVALIFNKVDLVEGGEEGELKAVVRLYEEIGYRVLETSAETGVGLDALGRLLCSGTSALVGPSGVGKSTLLNALQPGLELRTGELSHKEGRGRHTTVNARLIPLECGGLVADTPGFSDVGVWGADQRELEGCFPEFHPFREECRFRGCTHLHEPACGVRSALDRGVIDEGRFESYRALVQESAGS